MMKLKKCAAAACIVSAGLFAGAAAQAEQVKFTYTTTLSSSDIPGASAGDQVTFELLADNGGVSLASQSWSIGNIISGHLTVGSYEQTYVDGWYSPPQTVAFTTNASGALDYTGFYGTTDSVNHSDSFGTGGSVYLFNNAFRSYNGQYAFFLAEAMSVDSQGWHVSAVPEATGIELMIGGLGVLAFAPRRGSRRA